MTEYIYIYTRPYIYIYTPILPFAGYVSHEPELLPLYEYRKVTNHDTELLEREKPKNQKLELLLRAISKKTIVSHSVSHATLFAGVTIYGIR